MKNEYEYNDTMRMLAKQNPGNIPHLADDLHTLHEAHDMVGTSAYELMFNAYVLGAVRGVQMERAKKHEEK